jgi:hypothetical protein
VILDCESRQSVKQAALPLEKVGDLVHRPRGIRRRIQALSLGGSEVGDAVHEEVEIGI